MRVGLVQDSGGIAPPTGDRGTVIRGTTADIAPPTPPPPEGFSRDLVIIIAVVAALALGFAAFRAAVSWAVGQNRPYDAARRLGYMVAVVGAIVGAALVILLAGLLNDMLAGTAG